MYIINPKYIIINYKTQDQKRMADVHERVADVHERVLDVHEKMLKILSALAAKFTD